MNTAFDILNLENPHPFFEQARTTIPIFWDEKSGYWVITKYKHVKQIISDEKNFSAEAERVNYARFSAEVVAILDPINFVELYGLSTTENPQHDMVKKVLMPIFHDLFTMQLKPHIESVITEALEKIRHKKCINILMEFLYELPAEIIFKLIGIPVEQVSKVKQWSESRLLLTWGDKDHQIKHAKNVVQYWSYCEELLEQKLQSPQNDLMSKLLDPYRAGMISLHEIKLLCYGLIFSGHTTTSMFLAESLKELLLTGAWNDIMYQKTPFSDTVDELLRLCPSAFTRRRIALNDVEVGGHRIPKGSTLLLVIGSANRDAEIFENPDALIPFRSNANRHLTFGHGFHYCIGAKLVKMEYTYIMENLAKTFPDIRLSDKNTFIYQKNISIRALHDLWIEV